MPVAFTIDMTPPAAGQTYEGSSYPDRDTLRGGDGNDIIQGNHDLDRLFGGSGADTITGEQVETRDSDIADSALRPPLSSENSFDNKPPVLDPLVSTVTTRQFYDNFELSTLDSTRWTLTTGVLSTASVTTTPRSGPINPIGLRSAGFKGPAELLSAPVDLSRASSGYVTYQYQRAGFGDSPEDGNDLILQVEGLTPGTWTTLERQLGSGPDMSNFIQRRVALPSDALRSNVRFRFTSNGDIPSFDEWFVDEFAVFTTYGSPQLQAAIAQGLGDPVTSGPVAGKYALDFDGVNDLVQVPFDASLNPTNFTVEFWSIVEGGAGTDRSAVSTMTVNPNTGGYSLRVDSSNRWMLSTSMHTTTDALVGPQVVPGRLTHVAGRFVATGSPDANGVTSGILSLLIDGQLVATKPGLYKRATSGNRLLIGATDLGGGGQSFFNGVIDELRVWSSARTNSEIETNFRSTISPSEVNLAGYYRLDEGRGTVAKDLAIPVSDGTLTGVSWSTNSFEVQPVLHRPLTASRLASLTSLNASNRNLADVNGIETLVNLQSLNLSGNRLDNADLGSLLPRQQAGEQVGLAALESLDLSSNVSITNVGQLAGLPRLSSLNLEGTSLDVNSASNLSGLSSLTNLSNLTVPSQVLSPGQNVVTLEGQATSIPFQVGVLNFDGIDDFVTTTSASTLGLNGSFTASAWLFPTATDPIVRPVFGTQTSAGNQGLQLGLQGNRPFMGFFGNDLLGNAILTLNQWVHISWVYNQATSTQTMFVNGVQDSTRTGAASFIGTDPVMIGRTFSGVSTKLFQELWMAFVSSIGLCLVEKCSVT